MSLLGKMLGFGRNAHYDKGIRLFDQGLYEEALAEFVLARQARIGRTDPLTQRLSSFYTAESYAHLGHAALKQEQWERAAEYFAGALEIHPHYADLHFCHALAVRACRTRPDALSAALEIMKKALEINARFAKAHFYAGLLQYEMGDYEQGLASLETALSLEPGYRTEALAAGIARHQSGDTMAALQAFEMVSHTEVDDILFHYKLGDDMYKRGMYQEAIGEYKKALALNPTYADIRNHLGIAFSAIGQIDDSICEFRKALAINPYFVDAMVNLAVTLRDSGAIDEAGALFHKALENDPENAVARVNLSLPELTDGDRRAA